MRDTKARWQKAAGTVIAFVILAVIGVLLLSLGLAGIVGLWRWIL